jgi:hypothetical protein
MLLPTFTVSLMLFTVKLSSTVAFNKFALVVEKGSTKELCVEDEKGSTKEFCIEEMKKVQQNGFVYSTTISRHYY